MKYRDITTQELEKTLESWERLKKRTEQNKYKGWEKQLIFINNEIKIIKKIMKKEMSTDLKVSYEPFTADELFNSLTNIIFTMGQAFLTEHTDKKSLYQVLKNQRDGIISELKSRIDESDEMVNPATKNFQDHKLDPNHTHAA